MDPEIGTVEGGDVLIADDRIAEVGRSLAVDDARVLDAAGMIVLPGLVNAHLHTWQTGIRGISGDWSLSEYFRHMHRGMAASFTPEDIQLGTLVGALGQLNAGVTTLFDWLHNNPTPDHTDGGVDGPIESGIRAVFGHGSPKHAPKPGQPHFSEVPHPRAEIEWLRAGRLCADDGLVSLAMAILGPYFSTWEVTAHDLRLAAEFDLLASAHVDAGFARMVPDGIRRMCADGLIDRRFNVVHGSDLSDEEIAMLVDCGASFSITAEAEMQYGFGYPITGRVMAAGGAPSIGTDTESGMGGDMFTAMRMTLQMQRAVDNGPSVTMDRPVEALSVTTGQALEWATINGARALGMEGRIGSLTPGKRADVIVLRGDDLNLFPVHDPVRSIVLHANASNVDTVFVDGRMVKQAGALVYADLARRKEQLARSGNRLVAGARSVTDS
jgi:cytosine/adenosine deaminase-related metal-dependent hydrolase